MKSLATLCAFFAIYILSINYGFAQERYDWTKTEIEQLNSLKEKSIQEEKDALKIEVEDINARLQNGSVTESEADILKLKAAEKHARNIENKIAIVDNQLALISRNGIDSTKIKGTNISFGLGSEDSDEDIIFGIKVKRGPVHKTKKYDNRTSSGAFMAFGLNNAITEGETLENSDFKVAGSRFFEMGWFWKTRVFKNSNWLRVKYGLAFQFNGLKPTDNRFYVDTGEETELQIYPLNLDKSKFRIDNLVIPIHFELGPSRKNETEEYFRYSTDNHFKVGLGGYAGIKMSARQKLKFKEDGDNQKQKLIADYNTNNFIYGLSAYVGWGATSLYVKYDLNTIFKNNPIEQRNVSFGLRFDVD